MHKSLEQRITDFITSKPIGATFLSNEIQVGESNRKVASIVRGLKNVEKIGELSDGCIAIWKRVS